MGRKMYTNMGIGSEVRELFNDLYDGLKENEIPVMDVILSKWIVEKIREAMNKNNKKKFPLWKIAKLTGLPQGTVVNVCNRAVACLRAAAKKHNIDID